MSEQTDLAIQEAMNSMAASLGSMASVNEELLKASHQQSASLDSLDKLGGRRNKGIWSAADNIPVVGKTMRAVGKEMVTALKGGFDLQKKALSRGQNLDKVMKQNSATTSYLTDSMTGYTDALQTGYGLYEVGFRSNNKEMARLSLQTKLTGQNEKKVMGTLAKNTAGMGITQAGMTSLANTTLSVGQQYGMSTDELVTAVDSLGDQMKVFGAMGIGGEMMEAATKVTGSLGPAMANVGPELLAAFTKGDAMVQRSILGISAEVQSLQAGGEQTTSAAFDLLLKAGRESDRLISQYTAGAADTTFAIKNATDIYGKQIIDSQRVYKQWQKAADEQGISIEKYVDNAKKSKKVSEEFQHTWSNFMAKVWSPIQRTFMYLANIILGFITKFSVILVPLVQVILALIVAIGALKIATLAASAMKSGITDVAGGAGNMFRGAKDFLFNPLGKIFDTRMKGPKGGQWKGGNRASHMMTTAPGMKDMVGLPAKMGRQLKDSAKEMGKSIKDAFMGKAAEKTTTKVASKAAETAAGSAAEAAGGAVASRSASKAASSAASVPKPSGGGGGGGGMLAKFGKSLSSFLKSLGSGLAGLGKGVGKMIQGLFEGLARGIAALGKGGVLKGILAMGLLALAMVPLAFALNMMKSVGIGTVFVLAAALIVLGAAAFILGSAAPAFLLGALVIGAFGIALMPLAAAMLIASVAFTVFINALKMIGDVPIGQVALLGLALVVLGASLAVVGLLAPAIMLGSMALVVLGFALIPLANVLKTMGPAVGMLGEFATGLLILGASVAALFWISPFIYFGSKALLYLGLALIPLAAAMAIAAPGLKELAVLLATLAIVPIDSLFALGPALIGMAAGFAALAIGGAVASVADGFGRLFGGESPVEKLVKMGKAAKHINKLEKSLKKIPENLKSLTSAFKDVKLTPFYIFAEGIAIIKEALDSLGIFDMLKLGLVGKAMGGGGGGNAAGAGKDAVVAEVEDKGVKTAVQKLAEVYDKFADTMEVDGKKYKVGETIPGPNTDMWGKDHGPMIAGGDGKGNDRAVEMNVNAYRDSRQGGIADPEGERQHVQDKIAKYEANLARSQARKDAGKTDRTQGRSDEWNKEHLESWSKIAAHLEVLIEQTHDGNADRKQGNKNNKTRPSELGRGASGDMDDIG